MKTLALIIFLMCSKLSYCQDTIPVVMLYSDTALCDLYGVDDNGEDFVELGFDEYCYWKRGYKVGDNYLDADKKRIPTSNIVWLYKKLN